MADDYDSDAAFYAEAAGRDLPPDEAYANDPDVRASRDNVVRMVRKGAGPEVREMTEAEKAALPDLEGFDFWQETDFAALPRLDFIYSDFYARGYTSVSLAAPKVGKSMLALAEAIDMASGRGILSGYERAPVRVLYYNAEDDLNTLKKRVAALCTFYGIPQAELVGRLMLVSGVDRPDFVFVAGIDAAIVEPVFVRLERLVRRQHIDVAVFDPLQDLSHSPETNEVFRLLGQRLRLLASSCQIALGLVHHTRKVAAGNTPGIDDMRGGSALRGSARFNRILVAMTEEDGAKAGVANHRFYFRIGDVESNLAPPSADVNRWYEKVPVTIPNGESIGAIRTWEWPDAMDGISNADVYAVQAQVRRMQLDGMPARESVQATDWVGKLVAEMLNIELSDKVGKSRVKSMVASWIKTDILRVETIPSPRDGRDIKVVIAGENNPMSTEDVR